MPSSMDLLVTDHMNQEKIVGRVCSSFRLWLDVMRLNFFSLNSVSWQTGHW